MEKPSHIPPPLLHEVNELLEKERTLMELRLLEQEIESARWKGKYDELKENVLVGKGTAEKQAENLGKLADVEDLEPEIEFVEAQHPRNLSALLLHHVSGNAADFSDMSLSKNMVSGLIKALFGLKSEYPKVDVLAMRHCDINHDSIEVLEYLLRSSRLKGLDLSRNLLDDDVLYSFVEVLNARKKTPQYLLLHGQTGWTRSERAYLELILALHKDTWGLSISLEDTTANPTEALDRGIHHAKKKGEKDSELLYKDYKNPLRIARFLHKLQHRIKETRLGDEIEDELQGKNKGHVAGSKRAQKAAAGEGIGRYGKIMPRLSEQLSDLCVLGLTEHPFSAMALHELESTLTLLQSSLTDLDLSFSYLGYKGAQILQRCLQQPQCQLISLRLRGNALGNRGLTVLVPALQRNCTLTYLDVANNAISYPGLEAMTSYLLSTRILSQLDLRSNDLEASDAQSLNQALQDVSSQLVVRWVDEVVRPLPWILPPETPLVISRPRLSKKYCKVGRKVLLARINLLDLYFQYPQCLQQPFLLRWMMRPAPLRSLEEVQQDILQSLPFKRDQILEEPYALINGMVSFGWEMVVSHQRQEFLRTSDDISDEFFTRDIITSQEHPFMTWSACSVCIKTPPEKGILELYATVGLFDPTARFHPSREHLGVEWKDLVAYPLSLPDGWFYLGGDRPDRNSDVTQAEVHDYYRHYTTHPSLLNVTSAATTGQSHARDGHGQNSSHSGNGNAVFATSIDILRGFGWFYRTRRAKIVFEARLGLWERVRNEETDEVDDEHQSYHNDAKAEEDHVELTLDAEGHPVNRSLIFDYEWTVAVHPQHMDLEVRQRQTCSAHVRRSSAIPSGAYSGSSTATAAARAEENESVTSESISVPKEQREGDKTLTTDSKDTVDDADQEQDGSRAQLAPWQWIRYEVEVDNLARTDVLLLTAQARVSGGTISKREARALANQCLVRARNVQLFTYLGDIAEYDHDMFNEIAPTLADPQMVYEGMHTWNNRDIAAEQDYDNDFLRQRLETAGIDTTQLHNSHLRDVLSAPDHTMPDEYYEQLYATTATGERLSSIVAESKRGSKAGDRDAKEEAKR